MSMHKTSGSRSLTELFTKKPNSGRTKGSPRSSRASNQPTRDMDLEDALDALPNLQKVPSLDIWERALRGGLDWADETLTGSPQLGARNTHPRGSGTPERKGDRGEEEKKGQGRKEGRKEEGERKKKNKGEEGEGEGKRRGKEEGKRGGSGRREKGGERRKILCK